jgi:transposase InsO family protein
MRRVRPWPNGANVSRSPPVKARGPHAYWCIAGRQMDCALDGVKWWSLILLEGYSRTILAGALAPTAATWAALMVLSTAGLRSGAPISLVSDSGGAYPSDAFAAVCTRLHIHQKTLVSPQGESSLNGMETHLNMQRRLYDSQCSLARTPAA